MELYSNIKRKIIDIENLEEIREKHKDKKIVLSTGCFDIFHVGHSVFFNQCKEFGDILIVGIARDETVRKLKGNNKPINPEANRLYLVASIQDVDYAILNEKELKPGKIDFDKIMKKLKPDVFVLNDDDSGLNEKRELCNNLGVELKLVKRTVPKGIEATSTRKIIEKLKNEI